MSKLVFHQTVKNRRQGFDLQCAENKTRQRTEGRKLGFPVAEHTNTLPESQPRHKSRSSPGSPPPLQIQRHSLVPHLSCSELLRGGVLQLIDLNTSGSEGLVGGIQRPMAHTLRLRGIEAPGVIRLAVLSVVPHRSPRRRRCKCRRSAGPGMRRQSESDGDANELHPRSQQPPSLGFATSLPSLCDLSLVPVLLLCCLPHFVGCYASRPRLATTWHSAPFQKSYHTFF